MDEVYDNVMDHYKRPRQHGALPNATVVERADNPICGDRVTLYLLIEDNAITDVRWEGRGCTISQASTSMLTEDLVGKTVDQAYKVDEQYMLDLLGTRLSPVRIKCATLGVRALRAGLSERL